MQFQCLEVLRPCKNVEWFALPWFSSMTACHPSVLPTWPFHRAQDLLVAAFQLRCHTLAEHLPRIWVLVDLDVLVNCGVHTHKKPTGFDVKKKKNYPPINQCEEVHRRSCSPQFCAPWACNWTQTLAFFQTNLTYVSGLTGFKMFQESGPPSLGWQ